MHAAGLPQISPPPSTTTTSSSSSCQLNLFSCSTGQNKYSGSCSGRRHKLEVITALQQQQAGGKSCEESSSWGLKPGSAFAKVHFCLSEHTNPGACSNSLQLSLRQLMTTAQQQHCLISNVFLNLGCQGSLVGGCLLYFSYRKKKKCFFPPQTMTNPKTKKEGALPALAVKAVASLL